MQGIQGVTYNTAGGYYSITNGCNSLDSLPDIAFQIDGKAYSMPPGAVDPGGEPLSYVHHMTFFIPLIPPSCHEANLP